MNRICNEEIQQYNFPADGRRSVTQINADASCKNYITDYSLYDVLNLQFCSY